MMLLASNGAGKTTFRPTIEVLSYFELTASSDNSNTSVVLQSIDKESTSLLWSFEAQMGVGASNNDILCYLEIGEQDLYFNGLNLNLNVSGAQCEFVRHNPYTLYKWEPGDTNANTYKHVVPATCNQTLLGNSPGGNFRDAPSGNITSTDQDGTNPILNTRPDV